MERSFVEESVETSFSLNRKVFSKETVMALAALCASRVIMSFTPILITLSDHQIGPNATAFWREAIAFILLSAMEGTLVLNSQISGNQPEKQEKYTGRVLGLLLGTGIIATLYVICWVWSLSLTSVTNVTVISDCLTPLFTILGGWLFFGQVFDRFFLIGMVITIGGVVTIGLNDLSQAVGQVYGDLIALGVAIFYAIYYLLAEQLRVGLSTKTILLWRCGIGTVIMLPIVLVSGDRFWPASWEEWSLLVSVAFVGQILGQGLSLYSVKKLTSGLVAFSMLVVPVLSAMEATLILSEKVNLLNFVSFALVLLGMYFAISSSQGAIKE
jgi:drug/metabolite transporter (DMT)-like permease